VTGTTSRILRVFQTRLNHALTCQFWRPFRQFPQSTFLVEGQLYLMKTIKQPAAPPATEPRDAQAELAGIISEHPFLKGLDPHQCRILQDCAMLVRFKAGEIIFREGDPANRFYLILRGKVALESLGKQGRIPIQTIKHGDVLGWSWL